MLSRKAKHVFSPTVAYFAGKYLSLQSSSAASERLFPGWKTIPKMRNPLRGEMASDIIFLYKTGEVRGVVAWKLVVGVCVSVAAGALGLAYSTVERH